MTKKRKILWIIGFIILILLISFPIVYSYLSDADKTNNQFSVGGNKIELIEEFDPPEELLPGTTFTKDVKVKNIGENDCYIRIKAVFTNSDIGNYCTVDFNTTDYEYNSEDGYYYYKNKLNVGEVSSSLFTTVSISDEIPKFEIQDFNILVYAESIQYDGFTNYNDTWINYQKNKTQ